MSIILNGQFYVIFLIHGDIISKIKLIHFELNKLRKSLAKLARPIDEAYDHTI